MEQIKTSTRPFTDPDKRVARMIAPSDLDRRLLFFTPAAASEVREGKLQRGVDELVGHARHAWLRPTLPPPPPPSIVTTDMPPCRKHLWDPVTSLNI